MKPSRGNLAITGIAVALAVVPSACSGDTAGTPVTSADVTTITLSLNGKPIDLSGATLTCYAFEGHLSVEAQNRADAEGTHLLMDYYNNGVSLSIKVKGMQPDLYEYTEGENGQNSSLNHDGDTVALDGTIGVSLDDTTPPKPFAIKANCGKFVNSPPGSSQG